MQRRRRRGCATGRVGYRVALSLGPRVGLFYELGCAGRSSENALPAGKLFRFVAH